MNKSLNINKSYVTIVTTLFLSAIGTSLYFKFFKNKNIEYCDQSAFDRSKVKEKDPDLVDTEVKEPDSVDTEVKNISIDEYMKTSKEWYENDLTVNIKDDDGWRDEKNHVRRLAER